MLVIARMVDRGAQYGSVTPVGRRIVRLVQLVGHASQRAGNLDALAQDEVNKRVSLERATAVAQALVGMGVQPMLVQVAAAGDGQTLYSESTPAGEAGNRRAEVYLSQN